MGTQWSTEDNLLAFEAATITHVNHIKELELQVKRLKEALSRTTEICEDGDTGAPFSMVVRAMLAAHSALSDTPDPTDGEAVNDWISVDERLPEDSNTVMICLLGITVWVGHYNHGKKEWRMGNEIRGRKDGIVAVTHWMPKPEPPSTVDLDKKEEA